MSLIDPPQLALIRLLADGQRHSGSELAAPLGISREAVSKRVRRLGELGLEVDARSGQGYQLDSPLELLDADALRAALPEHCAIQVLDSTPSTNAWLATQTQAPYLCLAEHQSAGRGRRGRNWASPFAQNLYLSLRYVLPRWPERLPALSLVLGVALAETLHELGVPVQLKWPNDMYLEGRKCGGMLIEQTGEAAGPCTLIVGLGLNVAMRQASIDQAWTSLALAGVPMSRQLLATRLSNCLLQELEQLDEARIKARLQNFARFDIFHQRAVWLDEAGQRCEGVAEGLDDWGRLRLRTAGGLRLISAGDLSLRPLETA